MLLFIINILQNIVFFGLVFALANTNLISNKEQFLNITLKQNTPCKKRQTG